MRRGKLRHGIFENFYIAAIVLSIFSFLSAENVDIGVMRIFSGLLALIAA